MIRVVPVLDGIPDAPSGVRRRPRAEYGEEVRLSIVQEIAVRLIEMYQRRTADRPHMCTCRPTCSEYSRIAFMRYSPIPAFFMTVERLRECTYYENDWPRDNRP